MEDSAPLSSSYLPSRPHPAAASKAKTSQPLSRPGTVSSPEREPNKEGNPPSSLKSSSDFLNLLDQLKAYPSPSPELSPSSSPQNPRIAAIKRGEELILKDGWPSAEDLNQVSLILGEHFE